MRKLVCVFAVLCAANFGFALPCDGWTMKSGRSAASYFYEVTRECEIPEYGTFAYHFYDTYTNADGNKEDIIRIILDWFISKREFGFISTYGDPAAEAEIFWDRSQSHASLRFDDNQNLAESIRGTMAETGSDLCCAVIDSDSHDESSFTASLYINSWDRDTGKYTTFVYNGFFPIYDSAVGIEDVFERGQIYRVGDTAPSKYWGGRVTVVPGLANRYHNSDCMGFVSTSVQMHIDGDNRITSMIVLDFDAANFGEELVGGFVPLTSLYKREQRD